MPSDSLDSVFNPHTSSHGLSGAELTRLPLNALTSNQKSNCNARSRDTDETITLLARMARFIVADISDAKSVLQELRAIVPDLPSVPVQPIILAMQEEPGMFDFYRNRPSFLPVHRYVSQEQLLADLGEKVIRPAELKVLDLRGST